MAIVASSAGRRMVAVRGVIAAITALRQIARPSVCRGVRGRGVMVVLSGHVILRPGGGNKYSP